MSEDGPIPGNLVPHVINPQANLITGPEEGMVYDRTTNRPNRFSVFFTGEPEALGATQVFGGVVILVFGVTALISMVTVDDSFGQVHVMVISGLPFWSSILYISSGSVSLSACVKPTLGKVKASLVLNILSAVFSGIAIILLFFSILVVPNGHMAYQCMYQPNEPCKGEFNASTAVQGFISIVLLLSFLMFGIAIASSAFGCKTTCKAAASEVHIVVYQAPANAPDTTAEAAPLHS